MSFVVGEVSAPVTADSTSFEQAMGRIKEEGEKASKQVSNSFKDLGGKISKSMEKVGKSLSKYVTAPLMGAGILAAKSAIDFESAFAGVRKTVDATEEEFAALEKGIRDMAMELPSSANEIAGVAEAAGQLGIANDNILGFTRTMIDLGEATNLSADQAATQLARLANITQMPQDQFNRLGSSIVEVGNNLATTEAEIVDMAMGLAGVGKQIGLSEAQIIGMAGALSSVGVEAQAGGSAFSRVLSQMQLAAVKGGEELQNFAAVAGMSAEEFARKFKEDAAGALISFIQGLGNVQAQGGSAIKVLSDMGIEEIRLRDALLRTAGAGDLLAEAVSLSTQAWEENQSLSKETQQRYATMASQLKIMRNHITELAMEFGEVLAPYIKRASDKIKEITAWFRQLDPEMKKNVLKWAAIAASVGPVILIFAKTAQAITAIHSAGLILKPILSAIAVKLGLVAAAGTTAAATTTAVGGSAAMAAKGMALAETASGALVVQFGLQGAAGSAAAAGTAAAGTAAGAAVAPVTALGVATKFLLGPWGLLIAGIGAFVYAASKIDWPAENAADKISRMQREASTAAGTLAGDLAPSIYSVVDAMNDLNGASPTIRPNKGLGIGNQRAKVAGELELAYEERQIKKAAEEAMEAARKATEDALKGLGDFALPGMDGDSTWLDSVKEKISAIGTEIDISRAKFDLLIGELKPVGDETKSLNLKLAQEQEELELVGHQVDVLSDAVRKMTVEKGAAAKETRLLTLELMQAQKAYQDLQTAIEETQKALDKSSGNELQEKTLAMIQSRQMELLNQPGGLIGILELQKVIDPSFKMPEGFDDLPGFGAGGIAFHPMIAKIAEREPEAIIPLSKLGGEGIDYSRMAAAIVMALREYPQIINNNFGAGRDLRSQRLALGV